ncbi:MAG TPA: RecX family transcriptional regulator [Dysgonomonas sp.]|nr:RecX family transcriptional regulator [Dysgonomonas sp.]
MKYSKSEALAKLAAYCSQAERSEYDVRRKTEKWELSPSVINNIIDKLKKENFLNEERYCSSFINDKTKFNRWGETKIRFELKKKRISDAVINSCFADFENEQFEIPLYELLSSKVKSVKADSSYERRAKLIRFAMGRGYRYDQINKVLQKMNIDGEEYPE